MFRALCQFCNQIRGVIETHHFVKWRFWRNFIVSKWNVCVVYCLCLDTRVMVDQSRVQKKLHWVWVLKSIADRSLWWNRPYTYRGQNSGHWAVNCLEESVFCKSADYKWRRMGVIGRDSVEREQGNQRGQKTGEERRGKLDTTPCVPDTPDFILCVTIIAPLY